MSTQTTALREYLESILGFRIRLTKTKLHVPYSVQEAFHLFNLDICLPGLPDISVLAALERDSEYPGIVTLRKRLAAIEKVTDRVVIYVSETMTSVERRSLIDNHVNFIAIGRQFFAPELAMDLREAFKFRKQAANEESELSPATQAMLIQLLFDKSAFQPDTLYTADTLMGSYRYSRVTLSKAISELRAAELLSLVSEKDFSTRLYKLKYSHSKTYEKALLVMRNPIKKTVWVNRVPPLKNGICYAGETALSEYTMLAAGSQPVFAMTQKVFTQMLNNNEFKKVTHIDRAKATVEIWTYRSPKAETHVADEISLYLTLKEDKDERVQLALNELKEQHTWMKLGD